MSQTINQPQHKGLMVNEYTDHTQVVAEEKHPISANILTQHQMIHQGSSNNKST